MKRKKIMSFVFLFIGMIAIVYAAMWIASRKTYPIEFGVSFNQDHASSLGLDWRKTYQDMLQELKPKHIRIAAMWSDVEAVKDHFDFSDVDWMMNLAAAHHAKVVLVVGQKAPRWPECHIPDWLPKDTQTSREELFQYVEAVVKRYKDHPALDIWQVENEPFIRFRFGSCEQFNEDIVPDEIDFVKQLDPGHQILVTDSGELSTWRKASQSGDVFGTTLYRIVQSPQGKTITYDWLPAAFYRWKAVFWGRSPGDVFIAELQAEPWFTENNPTNTSVEDQEKTMNPTRMQEHIEYAAHTGFSRAYLWGVEWWYYMKTVHGDARYWDIAKEALQKSSE